MKPFDMHTCKTYGFSRGCKTLDVGSIIREFLKKFAGSRRGLVVGAGDIQTAFDMMVHESILDALHMERLDINARIAAAKQLKDKRLHLEVPHSDRAEPVRIERGGMQGGILTTYGFNALMRAIFQKLEPIWQMINLGVMLDIDDESAGLLTHLIWADNIFLFAESVRDYQITSDMITAEIHSLRHEWKPISLQFLFAGNLGKETAIITSWTPEGEDMEYTQKNILI